MNHAHLTLLVLFLMAAGFVSQAIPLFVVALTGALALAFLGVIPMASVYAGLANPTLVLFAGMFVLGAALFQTGADDAPVHVFTRESVSEAAMERLEAVGAHVHPVRESARGLA